VAKAKEIESTPEAKDLIAYCGLYCGDCYRYKGRLADMARDLRKELRAEKFDVTAAKMAENAFFKAFRNYPECYEVMGEIVKLRCKRACRGGGGPPVCKIRECCQKNSIDGCWECDEFETCKKLDFLKPYHDDAHLKNLRQLRKSGVGSFINGKRYW
jgi:hypothetical protein